MHSGNNADKGHRCGQHMIFWDTNRLMCGAVCLVGVGGGAVADADALIVSFTLQTIEEDLVADALPNSNYPSPTSRSLSLSRVPSWCCALGDLSLWHLCENCECESASERSDPPCLISLVHMPASCGLLACACSQCSLITLVLATQGRPALAVFSL